MAGHTEPEINHERRGDGPPLVLIHGLGSELCVWEPVQEALAAHHDVIALDLPGFGRSSPLPEGTVPTPAALAAAVAALMDDQGIPAAHLVGNSLGAWIALELAAAGRALTVTGLCPAGLWRAPLTTAARPVQGRGQRLARRLRPVIPVLMLSRRIRRAVLGPFVAVPDRVPYHAAWRMISSYARATAYEATSTAMRQDHFRRADAVRVPVTLAFGDRDRLIRPTRTAIPTSRTVVIGGCGHIPMWDDPAQVTEVVLTTTQLLAGARAS
jgi:pimeloyl-ACP methyl ester carboxylesterase